MTKKEVLSEVLVSNLSDDAKIYIIQNLGNSNVSNDEMPDVIMDMGHMNMSTLKDFPLMCNEKSLLKDSTT